MQVYFPLLIQLVNIWKANYENEQIDIITLNNQNETNKCIFTNYQIYTVISVCFCTQSIL